MKRSSMIGLVLIFLFAFCGHPDMSEGAPGPKMSIKERAFNFGDVKEGDIIEHTFTVVNEGDAELEIKAVKPG